jgi:hypothetical protein
MQQDALVELAESATVLEGPLRLSAEHQRALQHSKDDFSQGRSLTFAEAEAETDEFLRTLRAAKG